MILMTTSSSTNVKPSNESLRAFVYGRIARKEKQQNVINFSNSVTINKKGNTIY